jgi:hypothetical protein
MAKGRRVRKLAAILIVAVGFAANAGSAHAFGLKIGKAESIHHLADITERNEKGRKLNLSFKTTMVWFFGGVYLRDDGYVIGLKDDPKHYYRLTPEKIAEWQERQILPKPMPKYEISRMDYVYGYSLWIGLVPLVLYVLFASARRRILLWREARSYST